MRFPCRAGLSALAMLAAVSAGCQNGPRHTASATGPVAVKMVGDVTIPKEVVLPPGKATMRQALRAVGGPSDPTNAAGARVPLLAKYTRGSTDYYIETELIEDTPLGLIPLQQSDVITVEPWTETDLGRAVVLLPAPIPKDGTAYAYDQASLETAYGMTGKAKKTRDVDIQFSSNSISNRDALPRSDRQVLVEKNQIYPSDLLSLQNRRLPVPYEVLVLERTVDGRDAYFVLPLANDKKDDPNIALLDFAALFDGDVISIVEAATVVVPPAASPAPAAAKPKYRLPADCPPGQLPKIAPQIPRPKFDDLPAIPRPKLDFLPMIPQP